MDASVNRLLMISPYFVPMNYVGAKRTLHFCRHLPPFEWEPAVVALPASMEADPALATLVPDVPMFRGYRGGPVAWLEDLAARHRPPRSSPRPCPKRSPRGKTSDGWLDAVRSAADRYARYLPWALGGALSLAATTGARAVYVSAGPYSGLELGYAVSRILKLPLFVDLRDPWALEENLQAARTPRAQRLVAASERRIFSHAAGIILNTESALGAYRIAYACTPAAERMACVRNAFDPELYCEPASPPSDREPFRIGYYGHLRANKDAVLFLEGLARFIGSAGLHPTDVELLTFGERTPQDEEAIARFGLGDAVMTHPWVPFPECPAVLGRCHLLLDLMGPRHGLQISGKFYDYLACGRRILSISPNRELDAIYATTGAGRRVDNTVEAIADALAAEWHRRSATPAVDPVRLAPFTAAAATRRLVRVIEQGAPCPS
jgi:hypothetical protein